MHLAAEARENAKNERNHMMSTSYQFPNDFVWGVATASYQIEGASDKDGRKASVWDTFSATPGRVRDNHTGMVACDHYNRYKEDVALMAELGVKAYRFSIAWPRVIPDGTGTVNQKGLDFYKRLVDELLKHNITPYATLFHWDSPQALEDRYGSWRSRQMAKDFADYVTVTVKALGDKITNWMTINEIICFTNAGYGIGKPGNHAPGTAVHSKKEVNQTIHHALLAHGMGVQAIRAASPKTCQISLVDNCGVAIPVSESEENIAAATKCFYGNERTVSVLTGAYPENWIKSQGESMPDIEEGDMEIIGQPLDAMGLNIYTGDYVRAADNENGYEVLPLPKGYPQMHMPWLNMIPDSIYWAVRHTSTVAGRKDFPIYITENGCAADDEVNAQGEVLDFGRLMYLREHFRAGHRAVNEGYGLKGYFVWSFMDNFEWAWGYNRRFGITYVDYNTQKRIPKQSFRWYQEVIRQNRVV